MDEMESQKKLEAVGHNLEELLKDGPRWLPERTAAPHADAPDEKPSDATAARAAGLPAGFGAGLMIGLAFGAFTTVAAILLLVY